MTSTLEKIQANEAAVRQLSNSNIEISRRIMAMDQAQLSMSKTSAAVHMASSRCTSSADGIVNGCLLLGVCFLLMGCPLFCSMRL